MQLSALTLGGIPHHLVGQELAFDECPICHAGPGHFYVNVGSGLYHCHAGRCPAPNGRVLDHQQLAHWSASSASKEKQKQETKEIQLPDNLIPIDVGTKAHQYLKNRLIQDSTIKELCIQDWPSKGRILIPFFDQEGRIVQYTARDYLGTSDRKYTNAAGAARALYAPHFATQSVHGERGRQLLVVLEGPFDAIRLHQCFPGVAVALGGVGLTPALREGLLRLVAGRRVLLWLDEDPAGWAGSLRLLRELQPHADDVLVAPQSWYASCKDVGAMPNTRIRSAIEQAITLFRARGSDENSEQT